MMLHRGVGTLGTAQDVKALIAQTANQYGVPPALALAVAKQESGYNQSARGAAGEVGVFQLMPGTAAGLGVDPYDLAQNVQGGISYLGQMLQRYGGDEVKALWAYNAGPGNVAKGIEPASTRQYVTSILSMEPFIQVPDVTGGTDPGTGAPREAMGPPEAPATAPSPTYDPGTGAWTVVPGDAYTDPSSVGTDTGNLLIIGALALVAFVAIN